MMRFEPYGFIDPPDPFRNSVAVAGRRVYTEDGMSTPDGIINPSPTLVAGDQSVNEAGERSLVSVRVWSPGPLDDCHAIFVENEAVIDPRTGSSSASFDETLTPESHGVAIGATVEVYSVNVYPAGWKTATWEATVTYDDETTESFSGGAIDSGSDDGVWSPDVAPYGSPYYRSMGSFVIPP